MSAQNPAPCDDLEPRNRAERRHGRPTARLAFTPAEAAEALGVCRATIYNLMNDGTIGSVKIGRSRRIPAAALEALLDSEAA